MRQKTLLFTTGFFFVLSIVFGVLYFTSRASDTNEQKMYPLLAKRLFLENRSDILINFQPLRKEIEEYLDRTGVKHSFYFEYLFTGSTIRYGEDTKLVGASLMKIPVVMDLYKSSEQGKIELDQQVTVRADDISKDPEFGNQESLKAGDVITLREAAKIALIESDNTAAQIVYNSTQGLLAPQDQAINNLDIETDVRYSDQGKLALISARSYSSFIKCLYFSCFLSAEHSQEILNELKNTTGTGEQRIKAGIPKNVEVVQKIGSFSDITQSDCGIVYVPNRRYILCVMLDDNSTKANQHIKDLSEKIYDYVSRAN
ncbi:MAG TPA: class A beta-lactamase-related serine hydrolase [Candidatus Saccharibacteria bacterium]|mgnify:CR=1 FL=1|nr:class A beta-lactamase-related serine hydrolase [Candidatus Saccharibacteria bacterium]